MPLRPITSRHNGHVPAATRTPDICGVSDVINDVISDVTRLSDQRRALRCSQMSWVMHVNRSDNRYRFPPHIEFRRRSIGDVIEEVAAHRVQIKRRQS